ncbi:MAG TPA: hypothetical protein VLJ86_06000, partial [Ramlibacter sp.]|nr:hypothetical protein [Ramlibacter sp.]
MVAIISGESLGLNLNPAATPASPASQGAGGQGAWVNVATGNLVLQSRDDYLAARGDDVVALRTYNSQGLLDDDNADNWGSGFYLRPLQITGAANAPGSALRRTDRDGAVNTFVYDASRALYVSSLDGGVEDTIAYLAADQQFEWRDGATGATERYQTTGAGRLLASADTSGNRLVYGYDALGLLASVTTASGDVTRYDYVGRNLAQINAIPVTGGPAARTRYAYDASNRLTRVTVDLTPQDNSVADGKVFETVYTYDGASLRVASLTQTDGVAMRFTYVEVGGQSRVASVTDALGQVTRFGYGAGLATVTDPLGIVTRYELDPQGRVTAIVVPAMSLTPQRRI